MTSGATITAISTALMELPMRGSLVWGESSRLEKLEHVIVRLETSDGAVILSEAPVRPTIYGETVASIRETVERQLGPRLVGRRLDDREILQELVASFPFNHCARGALDTAVHLAWARAAGIDLAAAVGASRQSVPVSFILGLAAVEEVLHEARRVVDWGVRTLKVKLGRDGAASEEIVAALAHEFAGAGVTLYGDANQTFEPGRAERRLERLAKLGLAWIEEPLPVHLVKRRAQLRAESPVPVIADDSAFTPLELERELELDTFDILNVKPARTGISGSIAMIEGASAAGKGLMIGSQAASGLGTVHAALLALRPEVDHPCELSFPLKLEGDSLERPLAYERGLLRAETVLQSRPAPQLLAGSGSNGVRIGADSGGSHE